MANTAGLVWDTGWHIDCGASLEQIINNPDDDCVGPDPVFGKYYEALPNFSFDAVTYQPFKGTPNGEAAAAQQLINMTTDGGTLYLYETWPLHDDSLTLAEDWGTSTPSGSDAEFMRRRHQHQYVLDTLRSAGNDLLVVPAVEALVAFEAKMLAGEVPGQDGTEDLYIDMYHLTNLGRYVAANTMVATLFKQSTVGFPIPDDFYKPTRAQAVPLNNEVARIIQETVWDVVTSNPDTGVLAGDLDDDGFVGLNDLDIILNAWNQNVPLVHEADENNDGYVGFDDLDTVLGNWNASLNS